MSDPISLLGIVIASKARQSSTLRHCERSAAIQHLSSLRAKRGNPAPPVIASAARQSSTLRHCEPSAATSTLRHCERSAATSTFRHCEPSAAIQHSPSLRAKRGNPVPFVIASEARQSSTFRHCEPNAAIQYPSSLRAKRGNPVPSVIASEARQSSHLQGFRNQKWLMNNLGSKAK